MLAHHLLSVSIKAWSQDSWLNDIGYFEFLHFVWSSEDVTFQFLISCVVREIPAGQINNDCQDEDLDT